jgi:hypothetical protein
MQLRKLQIFAEQYGYHVEKVGRIYQWWNDRDHSIIGECKTIRECYSEISSDILSKVEVIV